MLRRFYCVLISCALLAASCGLEATSCAADGPRLRCSLLTLNTGQRVFRIVSEQPGPVGTVLEWSGDSKAWSRLAPLDTVNVEVWILLKDAPSPSLFRTVFQPEL
jgi:hypothetical protein